MHGGWGGMGGVKGGCSGLGQQKPTSFLAVSASQVCERQCMCVFEKETHVQSMTHCIVIIYCGKQGCCSKVNTTGNKLLNQVQPSGWRAAFSVIQDGGVGGWTRWKAQHSTYRLRSHCSTFCHSNTGQQRLKVSQIKLDSEFHSAAVAR